MIAVWEPKEEKLVFHLFLQNKAILISYFNIGIK